MLTCFNEVKAYTIWWLLTRTFPIARHNEIRDVTANLLTEVCHDIVIDPDLQPLTGEVLARASSNTADGARLDIAANGLWGGRFERTYLDVRVFNPHAPTNRNTSITNCYRKHEAEKKRIYEQRILEVEHSTFTPLVFSATGGMAKQCTTFYKRLASLLADKWGHSYSSTLCWLDVASPSPFYGLPYSVSEAPAPPAAMSSSQLTPSTLSTTRLNSAQYETITTLHAM